MVANLSGVTDPAAQIEIMTSMMAAHVAEGRRGIILVPAIADKPLPALLPDGWQLLAMPTYPA